MFSKYCAVLETIGIPVNHAAVVNLSEAAQLTVTDETLTRMLKFITDKYNSLDFSEIEKSAGDIRRFKYREVILENAKILYTIYQTSTDSGAKKYLDVVDAVNQVMEYLDDRRDQFGTLYKAGNGIVQLLYTSMVSACIYSIGALISCTIRFVTTEQDTDCQVLYDEIPGSISQIHIKNILSISKDLPAVSKLLDEFSKSTTRAAMAESVTLGAGVAAALVIGGIILLIPRIIVLIREVIYSIYYSRVKTSEMLATQIDLLNTNIESLEAGRGNKKVIARQKKIVQKLQKWQNKVSVKIDTTEVVVRKQKDVENRAMKLDHDSPLVQEVSAGDIMI